MNLNYCPALFHFKLAPFRLDLVVLNSLSFCICGIILISSFLKNNFVGYRVFNDRVFFFFLLVLSTLNISSHCLLVSKFYDEKLTEKIIDNPLYVNHFSPSTFKILFGVWKLDYYVSWCRYLWVDMNLLRLLNFNNYAFHKIEEVISNYIFKYSSVPLFLSCLVSLQCVCPSSLWNYACQVGYLHFFSLYSLSVLQMW